MKLELELPEEVILKEMGKRISALRLSKNQTQEQLAKEAGISKPTLQRLENGSSTQCSNLIRVLRALKILDRLDTLIPEPVPSPIRELKLKEKTTRYRASSKPAQTTDPDNNKANNTTWTWGEDA